MRELRLCPSIRVEEAEWLRPRLRSFGSGVASVVPDDFPAYIRILHPSRGMNNQSISWAQVAARSGRTMHRLVQFHAIARPGAAVSGADSVSWSEPLNGNLPVELLTALGPVLSEHTSTKDTCWFCLWEGYGWLREGSDESTLAFTRLENTREDVQYLRMRSPVTREVLEGPRVRLPNRSYLLFKGPLDGATELGWVMPGGSFVPQSPNLFWPQDHAWCVASEIDLFCTLVAGSEFLAEALLADERLEACRVFPGDPITYESDEINT